VSDAVYPTMEDIHVKLSQLATLHPEAVEVTVIGKSFEGRDIPSAVLTDKGVPDDDKERVLVIAGQHGSEEGGRISALALIDWLLSDQAGDTLKRQVVQVVPCVNPDGCERNTSATAEGVNLNRCYSVGGKPATVEARAVWSVAQELQPELAVDMHGLAGGGPQDMVMPIYTRQYTEDGYIHGLIARQMVASAAAAGFPHFTHDLGWAGWMGSGASYCERCYTQFHSLVFLTESNESIYTPEEMYRSGRGRITPLIRAGNVRWPWERYPGYPVRISQGSSSCSLRAEGATATERRSSRVDPERRGTVHLQCHFLGPDPLEHACGVCVRIMGHPAIKEVTMDGADLDPEALVTWQDQCSTFVEVVCAHLEPADHRAVIRYEYAE